MNYKKPSRYGPGGRNCPCCGPCPSWRKAHDRAVKRNEKNKAKENIKKDIENIKS